ncbi:MAG: hypothetical protein WC785_05590 [Tatlockia sp.]|jgi:hypothetical protein
MPNKTVANTQHGIDYQVHLGMFLGFWNAVENNASFTLRTEAPEEGKFDDLVITLPSGVTAYQSKHHLAEDKQYSLNHFTSEHIKKPGVYTKKPSKVALYIYFDSVFLNLESEITPHNFCFLTNSRGPAELENYIDKATGHFTPSFYKYPENTSCKKIVDSISAKSTRLRTLTQTQKFQYIYTFLTKLQFKFTCYNREKLKEEIKSKIQLKYKTTNDAIYHAFFHEFYDWTLAQHPRTWSNIELSALLDGWHAKYISIERLCGLTQFRVQRVASKLNHHFQRVEEMAALKTFYKDSNNNYLMVFGEGGIGKTTLIQAFYKEMQPRDGEMLFLSIYDLPSCETLDSIARVGLVKILFIDDTELVFNNDALLTPLKNYLTRINLGLNLKLVLLTRAEKKNELAQLVRQYSGLHQFASLEIKFLPIESVTNAIEQTQVEYKYLSIASILELHNQIKTNEGRSLLTIPFYLTLFLLNPGSHFACSDVNALIDALINKRGEVKKEGGAHEKEEIKERKSILRKLLLQKEYNQEAMKLPVGVNKLSIESLIADNILSLFENRLYFSHRLFEEWTIHHLIKREFARLTEGQEHPKKAVQSLATRLKNYYTYYLSAKTTEQIEAYSQNQLFPVFHETVDYCLQKHPSFAVGWLQAYFVKPVKSRLIELIKSNLLSEEQIEDYIRACKKLYLRNNQTITEKLENAYLLLELITDIYFTVPIRNERLEDILIKTQCTVIHEVYNFPQTLATLLLNIAADLSKHQTRYHPISFIFHQEALASMYKLLHNESRQLIFDNDDCPLWSTEIDISDFFEEREASYKISGLVSYLIDKCKVECIELTHLELNDEAIKAICKAISDNNEISFLNKLNFHDNKISYKGVDYLFELYQKCKFNKLYLGYNNINDSATRLIAKLIVFSPDFVYCDVSGAMLSPIGLSFLKVACNYRNQGFELEAHELVRDPSKKSVGYYLNELIPIMWAIEDLEIAFLKNFLQSTQVDLETKFYFYDDEDRHSYMSPLEYAREYYSEQSETVQTLLRFNNKEEPRNTAPTENIVPVPQNKYASTASQAPATLAPKAAYFLPPVPNAIGQKQTEGLLPVPNCQQTLNQSR